jgi:hypothetical protein
MSGSCRTQGPAEKALRKAIKESDKGLEVGVLGRLITKAIKEATELADKKKASYLIDDGK